MHRWLILGVTVVALEGIFAAFLMWLGHARYGEDWRYFKEGSIGTILSVANLVGCAVVCVLVRRRLRGDSFNGFWLGASILFALAAADDFFRLHESFSHRMSALFGYSRNHPQLRHLDDVLVGLYGLAAIALGLYHVRRLLRLRPMIAAFAVAGVFFVAMIALDLLRWSYAYEDSMKILAGATILCGLMYPLFVSGDERIG